MGTKEKDNEIKKLYENLYRRYGPPAGQWKMWCKRPKSLPEREEIVLGAILTQNTNWKNVEKTLQNLKKEDVCSLKAVYRLARNNKKRLAALIKPSRFYNQKADYLSNFSVFLIEEYGSLSMMKKEALSVLRKKILSLQGLGPETTDSILLYALDKPVFVIDEYTRLLAKRRKLSDDFSYQGLQELFEKNLPPEYEFFQDFHALIVISEKNRN